MAKTAYEYEIKLISIEGNEKIFSASDYRFFINEKVLCLYNSDGEVIGAFSTTKWGFIVNNKSKVR